MVLMKLEPLGVSLQDILDRHQSVGWHIADIRKIAESLLLALDCCHKLDIVHSSIQPSNIFLSASGVISQPTRVSMDARSTSWAESPFDVKYVPRLLRCADTVKLVHAGNAHTDCRSPESLLRRKCGSPADVWSLGCTLVEVFTGRVLFSPDTDKEATLHAMLICQCVGRAPSEMLRGLPKITEPTLREHLGYLETTGGLRFRSGARALAQQLVDEPEFLELIQTMLKFDPTSRVTAEEALGSNFIVE